MTAQRHDRYVPREPWRLFRELQATELPRSPRAVPPRGSPPILVSCMLVEQTFSVSRPPEVVFDYLANPSNVPDWQTSKTSVEQLTDGPPANRSRLTWARRG